MKTECPLIQKALGITDFDSVETGYVYCTKCPGKAWIVGSYKGKMQIRTMYECPPEIRGEQQVEIDQELSSE